MRRLKQLGWSVVFVELPAQYPWGLFPVDKTVLLRKGLTPSAYGRIVRDVLAALPAVNPGPHPA